MKIRLTLGVILAITLFSGVVFSAEGKKVLLVSDIDDTIKSTHVLSHPGAAARVANVTLRFSGMAQLYQLIINQNPNSTKIVYLSNALDRILGVPVLRYIDETFLSYNKFPPGELDMRGDFFEKDHKIKELRRLLTTEKPDVVIMIGDNGERDAEIYRQATLEFARTNMKMVSFIHQIYSAQLGFVDYVLDTNSFSELGKKLEKDQIGFVTPVEIAIELNQQGLLSAESKDWMIQNVAPYIANESYFDTDLYGTITFPAFKNCSDFQWRWPVTPELLPLVTKINSQCK